MPVVVPVRRIPSRRTTTTTTTSAVHINVTITTTTTTTGDKGRVTSHIPYGALEEGDAVRVAVVLHQESAVVDRQELSRRP